PQRRSDQHSTSGNPRSFEGFYVLPARTLERENYENESPPKPAATSAICKMGVTPIRTWRNRCETRNPAEETYDQRYRYENSLVVGSGRYIACDHFLDRYTSGRSGRFRVGHGNQGDD